jgi:dolichyl-phosphate-mannose-protein mannosyltransferase
VRVVYGTAVLLLAVLAIYAGSTRAYFFDDDFHWLVQTQSFAWANLFDLSRYDHFYRPVIELYFFSGLKLFGCEPFPFHVASICLHLLTTALVYGFVRAVTASRPLAFLSALFFAVQPGFTDAVTWIAAITDLLAVPFYVLTLWLHVRFLQTERTRWFAAALATFAISHLTQEGAATLLPMMVLTDLTFAAGGGVRDRVLQAARRWRGYAPFLAILMAHLVIAYAVNTRSYLVREGHYALGWHAAPNILNYVIWLYVGKRALLDYVATIAALFGIALWGNATMRFALAWIVVTLLPVSFFTWENAPRYLYLPAVGFAMLVAALVLEMYSVAVRHLPSRSAATVLVAVVVLLAARFGVFAKKAADSFPARTAPYERLAAEVRRANPHAAPGSTVVIDQQFLNGVPDLYREPAARVALCLPDLHLRMQ